MIVVGRITMDSDPKPFYKKTWFYIALIVVVAVAIVILVVVNNGSDDDSYVFDKHTFNYGDVFYNRPDMNRIRLTNVPKTWTLEAEMVQGHYWFVMRKKDSKEYLKPFGPAPSDSDNEIYSLHLTRDRGLVVKNSRKTVVWELPSGLDREKQIMTHVEMEDPGFLSCYVRNIIQNESDVVGVHYNPLHSTGGPYVNTGYYGWYKGEPSV